MATIYRKRGDSGPPLELTLTDANGGAVDLTNASAVTLKARPHRGGALKIDAAMTKGSDPTLGKPVYDFTTADLDTAGVYVLEVEVTEDNEPTTYPNDGEVLLIVGPDLR